MSVAENENVTDRQMRLWNILLQKYWAQTITIVKAQFDKRVL